MDFEKRLEKAIQRGEKQGEVEARRAREKSLSEAEMRQLHTKHRLDLSEHIEECVQKLADHFPGFQYETIYGERGWGGGCSRDDIGRGRDGKRASYYSRLEMTIRPFSNLLVLELTAKGTIRDKEVYNRTHYERVNEADVAKFRELIDLWVLEYAEQFAART